jgi:hypothetical protein
MIFQDRSSGKKIVEGNLKNGLYYLDDAINLYFSFKYDTMGEIITLEI